MDDRILNTDDPARNSLNENDVVDLILSSATSVSDFSSEEQHLTDVCTAYQNSIRLAFMSNDELHMLGLESVDGSLFSKVTTAFAGIIPFIESLGLKAVALFDKRSSVMNDRKALEDYLYQIRTTDKNIDNEKLKQLNLYFYEYKSLVNVISTLNSAISENDKYLKSVLNSRLLNDAFKLGYTNTSENGYVPATVESNQIKCHPTQIKFFETNTLDDLVFVTDQLSKSCGGLEMMLMHNTQFKSAIASLKAKPNRVKSLVGNKNAILKLGDDVNILTNHCGRIVNNVALLLKINKTLTTVTKDAWENVLGILD